MVDILKSLCKNLNIKVSYTDNKVTILSCGFKDKPLIRVNKIFKECNENIAYAIINYYTKIENREDNLKVIKEYANEKFGSHKYKIVPPDNKLCYEIMNAVMQEMPANNKNAPFIEMNISSMSKESFHGDAHTVDPDDSLKVDEYDILEVNIVVKPLDT